MLNMDSLLINKAAPEAFGELLKPYERKDEPFLFAIVGDLTLKQEYGQTAVVVTKERFFVLTVWIVRSRREQAAHHKNTIRCRGDSRIARL